MEARSEALQVYTWRYVIVLVYVLGGCANALTLLTFSPIADKANTFWHDIGLTSVNLLAVSFQIAYIPGTSLGLWILHRGSLRGVLVAGGLLTTVGCLVRWVGAYTYNKQSYDVSPSGSYSAVLIGTLLVAVSQPFYLNLPAKIGATWFPVKDRDIATTMCSLANPLGSALGSLLPPLFVTGGENGEAVKGVDSLLLLQLLVAAVALAFVVVFFRSEPPTPPSNSESKKITANESRKKPSMYQELEILSTNPEYLKLLISFSIALGSLNALAALLGQLPGGYSTGQFGLAGFALILSGFGGALIAGVVLEKSKAYRSIFKFSWALATAMWVVFMASCRLGIVSYFVVSAAFLGFALLPVIPSTIINAVECAHPIREDLAVGLLYVGANTLAIAMTFLGQVILASPEDSAGAEPSFPFALWSSGCMLLGLVPALLFNGKYLRLQEDEDTNMQELLVDLGVETSDGYP